MSARVLVAGVGNIFSGDDGFGIEVANRLAAQPLPPGVRVVEYGIRGVHLAYELLDGYEALLLIDALSVGEPPGTVVVIEPERADTHNSGGHAGPVIDAHSMSPEIVLGTLERLGGSVQRVFIVGCQPTSLEDGIGLSSPVEAAVEGAVELCRQLAAELVEPQRKGTGR